uniref:Mothers against decapentaplegic homolog n=1 Tax=Globodera rostochiensis TaxID=31243 RepID=A0A914I288_GLORO
MPWDCGLLCLFTERRRHIEVLWRRRLLVTDDERKAKRRFLNLMRGFDTEDLDVLRKAIETGGVNIKQCAPGPPMDLVEEREASSGSSGEEEGEPEMMPGCSTTIVSTRPRHSIKQMERDRILFQRQRFPTVASIQHQPASSSSGGMTMLPPTTPTATTVPISAGTSGAAAVVPLQPPQGIGSSAYQRRYSTHREQQLQQQRNRRDSKFSRRFAVYTTEDNAGNSLRPLTTTIITSAAGTARSPSSSDAELDTEENVPTSTGRRRRHHQQHQRHQRLSVESADIGTAASPARRREVPPLTNPDAGLIPQIDKPMSMPYLCCKMWRWKDLQVDAALHRLDPLPWCRFGRVTINNATVSCCNPFHYGLWIKPETVSTLSDEQSVASGVLVNGGQRQQQYDTTTGSPITATTTILGDTTIGHVRSAFQHSLQAARAASTAYGDANDELPPQTPPPAPPAQATMLVGNSTSDWHHQQMGNHLGGTTMVPSMATTPNRRISHSVHCQAMSWGRMARWQHNERVGDVVTLLGQFAVVGRMAGTVFDGQDVKTAWDVDNAASFALLRQSSDEMSEALDEVWLYNSSDQPLFLCISRNIARAAGSTVNPSAAAQVPNIRRLSPGYCVRVHRISTRPTTMPDHLASSSPLHQHIGNDLSSFGPMIMPSPPPTELMPMLSTAQPNAAALSLLTISVGAGWGANYECRCVTDLPCRYEVIFM